MVSEPKGVVAAGHEVTADAAAEILADGGNAFDAVLAALVTATVPEVVLASIGGGGFMMAHTAERGETVLYDFFAQTPKRRRDPSELDFRAIHADFGPAVQGFHIGAGATATPGFVPGIFAVHRELCRLPMARLFEPAIRAARNGVSMSAFQAYLFTVIEPILMASAGARALFAPGGALLRAGETMANPALADTLEALAEEGERLFREGEVGNDIARQSEEDGGHLTSHDLRAYEVCRRRPLWRRHRGGWIALNPAPAASGVLIGFGLALAARLAAGGRTIGAGELAAIMDRTNAVRADLGGAGDFDETVLAEHLRIVGGHAPATRGTTHVSVIDADGNAAAATISNGEGNGLMVGEHGFMLNNMLGEEDLNPGGFHSWPEATRLSSMMAPTIVREAEGGLLALGSGGSNRIRTAITQVLINLLEREMPLGEAVSAPRLHLEKCGTLSLEAEMAGDEKAALLAAYPAARVWPERNMFFGGVHVARRGPAGDLEGAGDPRRGGVVSVV